MTNNSRGKIGTFLNGAMPGITGFVIGHITGGGAGKIDRELADEYGKIAERMRKDRYSPNPGPEPESESLKPRAREETLAVCYSCSYEHLGEVKNCIEHASGREPGSREFEEKMERAMDKLLEVEREHLGPKDPANAAKIRLIRKAVESHIGPGEPQKSLAQIMTDIDQVRPLMKRLWTESSGRNRENSGNADTEAVKLLERFEETGDIAELKKIQEMSGRLGPRSEMYVRDALAAAERGDIDEAKIWVRGVKRGLQVGTGLTP